jgi:hypothetical protein
MIEYFKALWYHWVTSKRIPDIYWIDLDGGGMALVVRSGPVYRGRVELA